MLVPTHGSSAFPPSSTVILSAVSIFFGDDKAAGASRNAQWQQKNKLVYKQREWIEQRKENCKWKTHCASRNANLKKINKKVTKKETNGNGKKTGHL